MIKFTILLVGIVLICFFPNRTKQQPIPHESVDTLINVDTQRITISFKDKKIEDVLFQIAVKARINTAWKQEEMDTAKSVNFSVTNASVREILDSALKHTTFHYIRYPYMIIVQEKTDSIP